MTPQTIGDIAREHAANRPDAIALTFEGEDTTYGELYKLACQAGQAIQAAGVKPQERVAFLDKNVPEYFSFVWGGSLANVVSVAVNWRLAPPEIAQVVNDSHAKVLVVGPEFAGAVASVRDQLTHVEVIAVTGDGESGDLDAIAYSEWIGAHPADDPNVPATGSDVSVQYYTSGTTGLPKGAMLTNDNFFGLVDNVAAAWQFDGDSVACVCMPLFHVAGSGVATLTHFAGGRAILIRDVDLTQILDSIPEYGVTNAIFVPALLQFFQIEPEVHNRDYSSMRAILYGASPITEETLLASMKTFGCDFIQVYGLTETSGAVTHLLPHDHDPDGPKKKLLRSAGEPVPGAELKIVGDDGETLPDGEIGEVWIRSSQNMLGYWNMPDATASALPGDGWFRSGDAGYLEDGYLFIHDRVKDMIVSGGENIYPAEIENALASHPAVADVAVIGVPDEKWGETVKALIIKKDGEEATEADIISYCRERLAGYKIPRSIDWITEIPRNPSGKILKRELREPFWEGQERRVN